MKGNISKGKIYLVMLISMLTISLVASGAYAGVPVMPSGFYGSATMNGNPLPSGSAVKATIDGLVKGTINTIEDGVYGYMTMAEGSKLYVSPGDNGDIVVFYAQAPGMTNWLEASERGTFSSGDDLIELDLTFTGEEVYQTQTPPGGDTAGGTSGGTAGGTTGGTQDEEPPEETEETGDTEPAPFTEGGVILNIDDDFDDEGKASVEAGKDDMIEIDVKGEKLMIKVKSLSDFAVLLTIGDGDVMIGEGETKGIDFDGDGKDDVSITLDNVFGNKAEFSFERFAEPTIMETFGESFTGMIAMGQVGFAAIMIIIIIIVALGVLVMRPNKRKTSRRRRR